MALTKGQGMVIGALSVLIPAILLMILLKDDFFSSTTEWDQVGQENPKMVGMFNEKIKYQIKAHSYELPNPFFTSKNQRFSKAYEAEVKVYNTKLEEWGGENGSCVGCVEGAREQVVNYLNSISTVESYARYGVMSQRRFNKLELKITFNDGRSVDEVYTGISCNGMLGPHILMKAFFKEGQVVKVLTNGVEKKGAPEWVLNDVNQLLEAAIGYDIGIHKEHYFGKEKGSKDYEKEWDTLE